MKPLLKWPIMLVGLFLSLAASTQKASAQDEDVSLQSFYDELSPYGTWINDPDYGYVWRPDVDQQEFRPYYTNGRWVMTEYGNTWVSNYDWGWAPFHYGRWMYNRYNRWIWLPDTVWGPAWVDWRSGDGYYGWAPMAPTFGVHIRIGGYRRPDFCWNFIPQGNIYINTFPRYTGYRNNNIYIQKTVIINNTYVRNNRTYYIGPRVDDVRRATNRNVTVYNINRVDRRGDARVTGNRVNVYTPPPSRNRANSGAPAPQRSVSANVRTQMVDRNNRVVDRPSRDNANTGNRSQGNVDGNRPERGTRTFDRDDRGNTNANGSSIPARPSRGIDRTQATPQNNTNPQPTRPAREMERGNTQQNRGSFERQQRMEAPPQRMERGGFENRGGERSQGGGRAERGGSGNENGGGRSSRGGRG